MKIKKKKNLKNPEKLGLRINGRMWKRMHPYRIQSNQHVSIC